MIRIKTEYGTRRNGIFHPYTQVTSRYRYDVITCTLQCIPLFLQTTLEVSLFSNKRSGIVDHGV
jgi:hypothetical protein